MYPPVTYMKVQMSIASNANNADTATAPNGRAAMGSVLRASIVLPTHNRCASLGTVLHALAQQAMSPANYEVVVVADGCDDETVPMCRALMSELPYALHLIEQRNAGPAAARNRAIQAAHAELIVFIDDDVVPDAHWLEKHLAIHAERGDDTVVAIGPLLPPTDTRLNAWGAWEEASLCGHYAAMREGKWQPTYRQLYTGNASVARSRLIAVGGFDARYRRAEDIELGYRLQCIGCHFVFLHEARARHYVHRSFANWTSMPVAYGEATVQMGRAHAQVNVENAASEYLTRGLLTRLCSRLCLGSTARTAATTRLLGLLAILAWSLRIELVARACCGMIYNLLYYAGLSQELGGAPAFWKLVEVAGRCRRSGTHQELPEIVAKVLGMPTAHA